jgi:hypothetical protein
MNKIGNKLLCKFDLTKIYIYLPIFLVICNIKINSIFAIFHY